MSSQQLPGSSSQQTAEQSSHVGGGLHPALGSHTESVQQATLMSEQQTPEQSMQTSPLLLPMPVPDLPPR